MTGDQIILLILISGFISWSIIQFNRFIRWKNLMQEAWSGIDIQLKRRYDLIPNLVESVKGYAGHEKGLFDEISRIRAQCIDAQTVKDQGEAENGLTRNLKSLIAVSESYPDLKANQNFLDLQNQLSGIEDQIQYARRYYNGTVRNFNILIQSFPNNLLAGLLGFKQRDYFEIELATQRESPGIKL